MRLSIISRGVVLAAALLAVSGCETLKEQPVAAKGVIQFTVMNEIEQSADRPARAAQIVDAVKDARVLLDTEGVTLPQLQMKVMQRLAERNLEPSRMLAASLIVEAVARELGEKIHDGVLSPEDKVTVNEVIGWVEQAATFYIPRSG